MFDNQKTCPKCSVMYDASKHNSCPRCARPHLDPDPTKPANQPGTTRPDQPNLPPDGEKTRRIGGSFEPVVGWLVCIDGASKGVDYRIRYGQNVIGRDKGNTICIKDDKNISRVEQATILFDDQTNDFVLVRGKGTNLTRLNGRMLTTEAKLERGDKITLGETTLLFVPLCGESFSWGVSEEADE